MNEEIKTKNVRTLRPSERESTTETSPLSMEEQLKTFHQVLVILLIHASYILLEGFQAFQYVWLSTTMYSSIIVGTIVFIWLKNNLARFLIPISFVSLCIICSFSINNIALTVFFGVYFIAYYTFILVKRTITCTIVTMLFSAFTLLIFTGLTSISRGFYDITFEFNLPVIFWILWALVNIFIIYKFKKDFAVTIVFSISLTLLVTIGPFLVMKLSYNNLFQLFNIILLLMGATATFYVISKNEQTKLSKFACVQVIYLVAIFVSSYSFSLYFTWLYNDNSRGLIIDYLLFAPLAILTIVFLAFELYKKPDVKTQPRILYYKEKDYLQKDFILLAFFMELLIFSQLMQMYFPKQNLIKALLISLFFIGVAIVLSSRVTIILSIISSIAFLSGIIAAYTTINNELNLIILMTIAATIMLFSIINEYFLLGEPLTTSLSLAGSFTLMVSSAIYFSIVTVEIQFVIPSLVWAAVGLFQFIMGIIYNRLSFRRIGLAIILAALIYAILAVLIKYRGGLEIGVTFITFALVLFGCIFLFRWSEKRKSPEEIAEETKID